MPPEETGNTRLALDFANAMARGDSARAHTMLSDALQTQMTTEALARDSQQIVEYGEGAPNIVQVMTTMTDWPAREPSDTEWIYVAIANDTYSEAATVVVMQDGSRLANDWPWIARFGFIVSAAGLVSSCGNGAPQAHEEATAGPRTPLT